MSMKKYLLFGFTAFLLAQCTHGQDIPPAEMVCYNGSGSIFPASWLDKKTRARATAADTAKFHSDTAALWNALYKYPESFIKADLHTIYVVGKLSFNRQFFTGTNSDDAVYIGSEDNFEIEKTFHHEFSSILLRNHPDIALEMKWRELSPSLRGGSSAAAVKAGLYSTGYDSVLCEKGYLSPYSLSNWENDFNMYAENIFAGGKVFWQLVEKYPAVKKKTELITGYYHSLNGVFTYNYFRLLGEMGN